MRTLIVAAALAASSFGAAVSLPGLIASTVVVVALKPDVAHAAFRSVTSQNGASQFLEPNVTVTAPAGLTDGDFIVLCFAIETNVSTVSTLAGWTADSGNPITVTADSQRGWCFYKIAASEGASWNWTWSNGGGSGANYICIALSGRETSSVAAALTARNTGSSNTASGSPRTISVTTITAATGDDLVFFQFLDNTAAATMSYTPPSTFTEAADVSDSNFVSSSMDYKENVSSGATGTISGTGTYSTGNAGYGAFLIAVKAAGGGGGSFVCQPVSPSGTPKCGTLAPPVLTGANAANDDEFRVRAIR